MKNQKTKSRMKKILISMCIVILVIAAGIFIILKLTFLKTFPKLKGKGEINWIGNLIGTAGVALILRLSRAAALAEKASSICEVKHNDSMLSLFLLGILCNIFIFIAVDGYRNNQHELAKYAAIFLGVVGFILCGAEHCVADMFYYHVAGAWSADMIIRLLVITAGNAVGGILAERLRTFATE